MGNAFLEFWTKNFSFTFVWKSQKDEYHIPGNIVLVLCVFFTEIKEALLRPAIKDSKGD